MSVPSMTQSLGKAFSPRRQFQNAKCVSRDEINHITRKWRTILLDTRVKRGADVTSDQYTLQGILNVKLRANPYSSAGPLKL